MPSKHQWEDQNAVETLRAVFDSPVLLHVRTRILIHGRARKGDGACPCCGSTEARIIEERPDIELLVDRVTGERRLKSEVQDQAGFAALCAVARLVDVPLRCHRHQLRLLLDGRHKIIGALGGNRSGKTTTMVYWFVRQLLLRGGRGAVFWWVAPTRDQSMIAVEKLVLGEVSDRPQPPAFPLDADGRPLLVAKWPETERSSDQRIILVDGTAIALKPAHKPKGDNLKGRSVRGILLDEACAVPHRANWGVLLSRLTDSGGQLAFATTPKGGHWLKEDVVDLQKTNKEIHVESLSARDNPWVSKEELRRMISVCRDENHVLREIDGQWVGDQGSLWVHFDLKRHTIDDPSFNMPRGRDDVTAAAIRAAFRGSNPYSKAMRTQNFNFVGGQDFNVNPCWTIIGKVFGEPGKPETWGVYVLDEVPTYQSEPWKHANRLKSEQLRGGRVSYAGIPISCDSTGVHYNRSNALEIMAKEGFDARPCGISDKGHPRNPNLLYESIPMMHQLMREDRIIINGKCHELLKSITEQQVRPDGRPEKVSHTASDRLSGPIDALRYLCWILFQQQFMNRKPAQFITPDG